MNNSKKAAIRHWFFNKEYEWRTSDNLQLLAQIPIKDRWCKAKEVEQFEIEFDAMCQRAEAAERERDAMQRVLLRHVAFRAAEGPGR